MRPERSVRTILFDVGNTLAFLDLARVEHVLQREGAAFEPGVVPGAEARARRRLAASASDPRSTDASRWNVYMDALLEEAGVAESAARAALARAVHEAHRAENLWRFVPEGTHATLDRLQRAGLQLGVVSNADGRVAGLLADLELAPFFEVIVDSAVVGVEKPDPRIFAIALEVLGAPAATALYLGDIPAIDVRGARAAGLEPVLLDPLGLEMNANCLVIESITALAAIADDR